MKQIKVNTNKMRATSDQMQSVAKRIEDVQRRIAALSGQLELNTGSAAVFRRSLRGSASGCGTDAQNVRRLAGTLKEITSLYEQAERNAKKDSTDAEKSFREEAEKIRNELEDIGGILGMDCAAVYSDDPVNLSNGNYVYEKTYFSFDTVLPMSFRMFYNACGKDRGALGIGWMHSFEKKLVQEGERVKVISEDGSAQTFSAADGSYVPCPGTLATLSRGSDGWVLTDEEHDSYFFDDFGKFTAVANPDNWRMDLQYQHTLLTEVTSTDGITLRFAYGELGNLVSVSDHTGRMVEFTYEDTRLVSVKDPEGNITRYEYDEKGQMCRITAPTGDLSVENTFDHLGRTLRQEFADGGVMSYEYLDDEKAVTMVRQNGSRVTYYHDELFRNVRTVYSDGEEHLTYNDNNQRTSFVDKLGRTSRYDYDAAGKLKELVNAMGSQISFDYNAAGQLTQLLLDGELMHTAEYDRNGHQILSKDANGEATGFEYDARGRLCCVTHEDGSETRLEYDEQGNIACVRDPVSGCTRYWYDACRRTIRSEDALGNQTRYEYNANDQITRVINAQNHSRSYFYDPRGNMVKIIDFNGGITEVEYNAMNRPVMVTDPDGNQTRFEYDQMSNMVRRIAPDGGVTEYGYDSENRMTSIRHPMGGAETAEYDAVGNLVRRCAPDGGEYLFEYDALNRPVSVTDPVGGVRRAEYDKLGNVIMVRYEDDTTEFSAYDRMGRRLSHTDQSGYTRYFRYNSLGKMTEVSDDSGVLEQYVYGPGGMLLSERGADGSAVSYCYDAAGNVSQITDSVRGTWKFKYDTLGRMCEAEHVGEGTEYYEYDLMGNICAVTDGMGQRTQYRYSKAGVLEKVTDARGFETGYRYDGCQRLLQILRPESGRFAAEGADGFNQGQKILATTYEWDRDGNVVSVTDSAGGVIRFGYDVCGRLSRKQDQDGNVVSCAYRMDGTEDILSFSDGRTVRYQYDALKRLAQVEDWLGITTINRDAMGRVSDVTDHEGNTIGYSWDGRGQCTAMRYPDGASVRYEYDQKMHLSRLISDGKQVKYSYYENGQLQRKELSDAMHVDYRYDGIGRIAGLAYFANGVESDSFAYSYDACSRKNTLTERHSGMADRVFGFSYNPLGCLERVTCNGQPYQAFEYDAFGNRSRMISNGAVTDYSYDALGRLLRSRSDGNETTYSYDNRGNLTGETVNGIRRLTLHFDALNRLSRAHSDSGEAEYTYNGLAMLTGVRRSLNGRSEVERMVFDYALDSNRLIGRNENGCWENIAWDHEPVFSGRGSDCGFFLSDERGSHFGYLQGQNVSRYSYDPFGNADLRNSNPARASFAGYRYDPVTGYYDAGWRQYDASTGRFISQDPVAGAINVPMTLNPYLYCMCDPVNHLDPGGMIAAWLAGGIVGAVVNVGSRVAGDVIKSVKTGKVTVSSWQSYVGSAAGGFVQGSVLVASGGNTALAGAAGSATETLVGGGLSMITGAKGYTKADGYTIGSLLKDTASSAVSGAAAGAIFGSAAKHLKIPGITAGKGSYASVWKQVMTKASKDMIKNVTWKTLGKGLLSFGLVKTVDKIVDDGIKLVKDYAKDKAKELLKEGLEYLKEGSSGSATSAMGIFTHRTATCATT